MVAVVTSFTDLSYFPAENFLLCGAVGVVGGGGGVSGRGVGGCVCVGGGGRVAVCAHVPALCTNIQAL